MRTTTQILVIGGGPAGSTAAGLLAKEGFEVTLLEREHFPRYHIGESLLPSCRPILERLGVWDKIASAGFQPKGGAYYFWGPEEWEVRFRQHGRDGSTSAWQVIRADFDKILLDHAREVGVDVTEGIAVKKLDFDGDRPVAAHWAEAKNPANSGRIEFDYLVDASGRGGVMATKYLKNRKFHNVFRNVAAWSYWKDAKELDRGPRGAITVASVGDGWFWGIPLPDGTMSVGLVTGKDSFNAARNELGGVDPVYHKAIGDCPAIQQLLIEAEQVTEVKVEQDYSYAAEQFQGPGYLLAGDAACFLDPLLSTGVHLGTYSALIGTAAISSVIRGEISETEAWDFYEVVYRRAYERLLVLVSTFYESYRGKEHHFFRAQQLSEKDWGGMDVQAAFDRFVTGIADLEDTEEVYRRIQGHLLGDESGKHNPLDNLNRVHEHKQAPEKPEKAINGLYLSYEPQIGIRRA
ncbi:NAD(P)/FAD-dependent oxidoreductase [Amycolatopsis sp. lyj-90]|uniref:NAD(P)/FAD-dependent oxidoreductase n=1 Tax=Amycolatopsis sp. lyj-90 TaxID=2789285 RepID=UPI003979567E